MSNSALLQYIVGLTIVGASILTSNQTQAHVISSSKFQKQLFNIHTTIKPTIPRADLIAESQWQKQIDSTQNTTYSTCLFGDSISSSLGSIGNHTFNFAMGGMTTSSLVEQLKALTSADVKCQTAIIAMGTNDAASNITNEDLSKNFRTSISLVRGMGATKVFLIPAFYSTLEASRKPSLAGSISRVEEVNATIRQVAAIEKVLLFEEDIQPLYQGQTLKKDLTVDGVHLNSDGQTIYRQALLKILNSSAVSGLTDSQ